MFVILPQRCLCWLGHVCMMEDSRHPNWLWYSAQVERSKYSEAEESEAGS